MNDSSPASKRGTPEQGKPRRSTRVLVLFAVSLTISLSIFAAVASKSVSAISNNESTTVGPANVTTVSATPVADDEIRAAAKAADQKWLRATRARSETRPATQNATTAREVWKREVEEIRQQLAGVREFPRGSIAWHRREALKALLEDAPPASP